MTQSNIPGHPSYQTPAAPQGFPGPNVPLPPGAGQAAPPPAAAAPQAPPPPAAAAPQAPPPPAAPAQAAPTQAAAQPQSFGGGFGAAIAGAEIGVERLPQIPPGNHILRVDKTLEPSRTKALVAEFTVVETDSGETSPDVRHSFYQSMAPRTPEQGEAQRGACLALLMRATGFNDMQQWSGTWSPEQIAAHIDACFVEPGPLAGRMVRCTATDSGKLTRAKPDGTGGGKPIINYTWSVHA